eukprot:6376582-Prymnesium_polylepis.1
MPSKPIQVGSKGGREARWYNGDNGNKPRPYVAVKLRAPAAVKGKFAGSGGPKGKGGAGSGRPGRWLRSAR